MKRKKLLRLAGMGMIALLIFNQPACTGVDTIPRIDLYIDLNDPTYYNLQITGNFIYQNGLIIFKGLDQNYYALSQYCTYDGCNVEYQVGFDELDCPCEGSKFDKQGFNLMGPASIPLYEYTTSLGGNGLLHIFTP